MRQVESGVESAGNAEVAELDLGERRETRYHSIVAEEDVLHLDVAVQDLLGVEVLDADGQLGKPVQNL